MPDYGKLVQDLGVADKVGFTGFLEDDKIVSHYNLSDLFILPSLDRTEDFGIALIEAMACEKPVTASNLPGVRTIVDDGLKGFLVTSGDLTEISGKLQLLIVRADLRREFGKRGRERVLKTYLWHEVGRKVNDVYSELLAS